MSTGHQGGGWMNEEQREATREQAAAQLALADELECFICCAGEAGCCDFGHCAAGVTFHIVDPYDHEDCEPLIPHRDPRINRYAAAVCFEWWFDQQNVGKWVGGEFEYTHAPGLCHQMMLKASAFRKKYGAR